jgi:RecB family exonuclease
VKYSVSRLLTLMTCPYQYYLSYVVPYKERLPGKETLSRILGSVIHKVIESDKDEKTYEQLEEQFVLAFADAAAQADLMVRPGDNIKTTIASGKKMLYHYIKQRPLLQGEVVKTEYDFTLPYYGYTLRGKIDRVVDNRFYDFKTGKYDPYSEFLPHNLQFAIYRLGFMNDFGIEPEMFWFSLVSGKLFEVNLLEEYKETPGAVLAYLEYASKYAELLESVGYLPLARQGLSTSCNNCEYKHVCIG